MEQTTYLCKFDTNGRRTETLLTCEFTDEEKAEKLKQGYIEIDEEEWSYYVGNKGQGKGIGSGRKHDNQNEYYNQALISLAFCITFLLHRHLPPFSCN